VLYRAAHALDAGGRAREVADSLSAELYGVRGGSEARSLFRYFEGRSSLAAWLRAVLAQRYVDRIRAERRLEPLPDEDQGSRVHGFEGSQVQGFAGSPAADVDRPRYLNLIRTALGRALARLDARDRLRLACYYVQELTLAQIGRVLSEHEATVSRHLARTRRAIRDAVARDLRDESRLSEAELDECFASVVDDPGPLDLTQLFEPGDGKLERRSLGEGGAARS
jgi:RNA polymerase sigma factor (sigma-70 family)